MVRIYASAALLLVGVSHAFVQPQFSVSQCSRHANGIPALSMSEPSDTSSDAWDDNDVLTVDNAPYDPSAAEALVTNVLDLIPDTLGEVSESTRATINEVLLKLEALNPTTKPTMSPLLNGVWELRYAGGYTAEGALPSPTRYDDSYDQT